MRATWEALKQSLVRSVGTLGAKSQFEELKRRWSPLARFSDAEALLAYLNSTAGDLDEKDTIYAALVQVFTSLALREFGEEAFRVRRMPVPTAAEGRAA